MLEKLVQEELENGNTIVRDGEKLNFEQWIIKRVNETGPPARLVPMIT